METSVIWQWKMMLKQNFTVKMFLKFHLPGRVETEHAPPECFV